MGILLSKGIDKVVIDPETGEETIILGKTIFIKGTEIELQSCYARIEFFAQKDGVSVHVNFNTYISGQTFEEGSQMVVTDIRMNKFEFKILETELQSIDVVLQYSVEKFIDFGYSAEIV